MNSFRLATTAFLTSFAIPMMLYAASPTISTAADPFSPIGPELCVIEGPVSENLLVDADVRQYVCAKGEMNIIAYYYTSDPSNTEIRVVYAEKPCSCE